MRSCALVIIVLFASCSGTKHLPPNDTLYIGTKQMRFEKTREADAWSIDESIEKKAAAYWALADLPNGSVGIPNIRLVPTRLLFYNWFYTEKEKGFSHWMMNNFGEPPVTINYVNPDLKVRKVINIWENYGHFGTTGSFSIRYSSDHKKGKIYYTFSIPRPYTYRQIIYGDTTSLSPMAMAVDSFRMSSILRSGDEFNLDKIKEEKFSLFNYLQDRGYFYLKREDIRIDADTTVGKRRIDLLITASRYLPASRVVPQKISSRNIVIDSIRQEETSDKYYRWTSGKIRKRVFDSLMDIRVNDRFNRSKVLVSTHMVSELGVFTNPVISFDVSPVDSSQLHANISMEATDATIVSANAKGNYTATGYIGPSVGFSITQLNLFGGAENFSADIDAYYNFPFGVFQDRISNSSGISFRSNLSMPVIRSPLKFINRRYSLPKRFFSLNAELNNRQDYFRLSTWSLGYGLTWKSSPRATHRLMVAEATFSDIVNSTERFDSLVLSNPLLRTSITDQFIFGSSYRFKYDNLSLANKRLGTYFEGNVELAGNTFDLFSRVAGSEHEGQRSVLGLRYSQYALFSYDFRVHLKVTQTTQLAFRHIGGIGLAYGNSDKMPFIKQFFIGGSNSLRPINARSIGPGRYYELDAAEINKVGDLKFEWNLEYRIKLAYKLSGAIWHDAGNIWLLRADPDRPYSQVRWNHIFADSFLTSGVGLRLDVNFLVLRVDYGAILYAPIFIEGYKWIWQNKLPLHHAVIGFGLPF